MDVKNILLSKTLWLNLLGPVFAWLATKGIDLDADTQAAVIVVLMSVLNIVLRRFTKTPVTLTAPIGKPPTAMSLGPIAFLLAAALGLSGCTVDQIAKAQAEQKKISDAIATNAVKVQAACGDVLLVANNPLTDLAAATVPVVGQVQAAVKAGCSTAEGILEMAKSASTVDWLASAKAVMASQGTVLPPPVAPAPIAPTS